MIIFFSGFHASMCVCVDSIYHLLFFFFFSFNKFNQTEVYVVVVISALVFTFLFTSSGCLGEYLLCLERFHKDREREARKCESHFYLLSLITRKTNEVVVVVVFFFLRNFDLLASLLFILVGNLHHSIRKTCAYFINDSIRESRQ